MKPKLHGAQPLSDLVGHVRDPSHEDGPIVDILPELADRILAMDRGHVCARVPTDAEVDLRLAGDEPEGTA